MSGPMSTRMPVSFLIVFLLELTCVSTFASDSWKCSSKYFAGIMQKPDGQIMHSSQASKGSPHLFSGIGTKSINLQLEGKSDVPDVYKKLDGSLAYGFFKKDSQVIWKFYDSNKVAIKQMTYLTGVSVVTTTSWFECKDQVKE